MCVYPPDDPLGRPRLRSRVSLSVRCLYPPLSVVKSQLDLRSSKAQASELAPLVSLGRMVKVRLAIRCIYDRPWPAQRPVHNRASRLQPFDPDGSQHTLKCSPAALDPRCSCWQRAAVVPPVTQPCSGAALYALACKYQTQLKPRKYSIGLLTSSTYTLYLVVGSIKPQTNIGVVRRRASHQASHIRKHTPRSTSAAVTLPC